MGKVIWSPSALNDVDLIAEYIARDSVDRASLFVLRIIEATDRLQEFPQSGRVIPEFDDENRHEIIYGDYRIMYYTNKNDVWITAVVHGSRLL